MGYESSRCIAYAAVIIHKPINMYIIHTAHDPKLSHIFQNKLWAHCIYSILHYLYEYLPVVKFLIKGMASETCAYIPGCFSIPQDFPFEVILIRNLYCIILQWKKYYFLLILFLIDPYSIQNLVCAFVAVQRPSRIPLACINSIPTSTEACCFFRNPL